MVKGKAREAAASRRPAVIGTERAARTRLPDLERLLHERMRLGIVSALAANPTLTFNELKALLGSTDGNLSVLARSLEDAGYLACAKTFAGRVPRTAYRLTAEGRRALERYLGHLEALIAHARGR